MVYVGGLTVDGEDNDGGEEQALTRDKGVEVHEVSFSDTVVHPGTVVVETIDTALAKGAVSAARGSDYFAVGTETTWFDLVQ